MWGMGESIKNPSLFAKGDHRTEKVSRPGASVLFFKSGDYGENLSMRDGVSSSVRHLPMRQITNKIGGSREKSPT